MLVKEIKGSESWGLIDRDDGVTKKYSRHVRVEQLCCMQMWTADHFSFDTRKRLRSYTVAFHQSLSAL